MEVSKIRLSSAEMELMQNADIILTKNRILEKMRALLEEVRDKQIDLAQKNNLTADIFKVSPKISKGENYLVSARKEANQLQIRIIEEK